MNRLVAIHMLQPRQAQAAREGQEAAIQTWANVAYLRAIYAY